MAITDLYGKILAYAAKTIRNQTSLPALVNHTLTTDPRAPQRRNGVVEVIVPPEFVTRDVVPASVPPASQNAPNPTTVQVSLDYWKEVNFPLTEKHIQQVESAGEAIPMFLSNAVGPIVDEITTSLLDQYTGIYGFTGTPGTTPFAAAPTDAQEAKKILTKQKCPRQMRQIVLGTDAYANATGLEAFAKALNFGSTETITEGVITRAYGFDWHEDVVFDDYQHINSNGTPAGWLVNGAIAVGDSTVSIDTGANDPVVGDIFTVAGDSQTYVVKSYAAGTLTFAPAAKVAWANNAALTFKAAHAINLAFHPYAFAFASSPTAKPRIEGISNDPSMTWVDEMTGVALKLEIKDEYHQTGFYLSCLWGAKLVDPRLATRIAG